MPEVDQQPKPIPGGLEVIVDLSTVLICQFRDRLQFDDDLAETNKVRHIALLQAPAFVAQLQARLGTERNLDQTQFDLQTLLINGFEKPAPFLVVDLETSPDQRVTLGFE